MRQRADVRLGDAFDLVDCLPVESIDLVITSPPYWGLRTYNASHNWEIGKEWEQSGQALTTPPSYNWYREHCGVLGLEPTPDWFIAHLVEFFTKVAPALRAGGSLWINLGDTYFARWASIRDKGRQGLGDHTRVRRRVPMGMYRQEKQLLLIPSRFAIAMQEAGWILRNDLIWFKPNIPPRPERDRLRLSHEHFFHFVKRPKGGGRAKYYYDLSAVEDRHLDVVTVSARPGEDSHSATFPDELIVPRIVSSCPPGGTVLDPFCGSGRALRAALRTGRSAIGFEISDEFAAIANRLLREESDSRREGTNGQSNPR